MMEEAKEKFPDIRVSETDYSPHESPPPLLRRIPTPHTLPTIEKKPSSEVQLSDSTPSNERNSDRPSYSWDPQKHARGSRAESLHMGDTPPSTVRSLGVPRRSHEPSVSRLSESPRPSSDSKVDTEIHKMKAKISLRQLIKIKDPGLQQFCIKIGASQTIKFLYEFDPKKNVTLSDLNELYSKYFSRDSENCISLPSVLHYQMMQTLTSQDFRNSNNIAKTLYRTVLDDARMNILVPYDQTESSNKSPMTYCLFATVNHPRFQHTFYRKLFLLEPECRKYFYSQKIQSHASEKFSILMQRKFVKSRISIPYYARVISVHRKLKISHRLFLIHKYAFLSTCDDLANFSVDVIEQIHEIYDEMIQIICPVGQKNRSCIIL